MTSNDVSPGWWQRRKERIAALSRDMPAGEGPYFTGPTPFVLLLVLAVIGTFATAFLSYRHILLVSQTGSVGESVLCRAAGRINCDAILLTDYSVLFSYFPSAVLGLMGFVFVLWMVSNSLLNERIRKIAWAVLVLYFFAAIGFSWYYVYIMAFEVDFICTWCIVVHLVNLISLIIVVVVAVKNRRKFLLPEMSTVAERVYVVLGGVFVSLLVFFAAGLWEKALSFDEAKRKFEDLANDPLVIIATLVGSPDYQIPISSDDPVYGSHSAAYSIILFADFQCPSCARTDMWLRKLVDANPKTLKLVYKSFPLSEACNPLIVSNIHPLACEAATAAYASFLLGGSQVFWKFADLLFEHQKELNKRPWLKMAAKLNLDIEKFEELLKTDSVARKKVLQDIEEGNKLRLDATPEIFFEGKRIPRLWQPGSLISGLEGLLRNKYPNRPEVQLHRP